MDGHPGSEIPRALLQQLQGAWCHPGLRIVVESSISIYCQILLAEYTGKWEPQAHSAPHSCPGSTQMLQVD